MKFLLEFQQLPTTDHNIIDSRSLCSAGLHGFKTQSFKIKTKTKPKDQDRDSSIATVQV